VVEIISPYILPRAMVNVYSGEDVDDSEGFMLLRKAEHGTFTSLPASVSIHRVQTSWKATGMYPGIKCEHSYCIYLSIKTEAYVEECRSVMT
jgi:hypothetical protein